MNAYTSSEAPVVPGDLIIPLMKDFFLSISLEQTVELAIGEPDADTLSKVKELVLNVADQCTGYVLRNIYKGRFTSGDVETAVGKSVLTSFVDFLKMHRTTQPKSFDTFNKLFVKLVKEKVSYFLGPMDDELAFHVSEMDRVDLVLPHAVRLIEELLAERCIQHRQSKQNVAEDQQDALNRQNREKELELKMVDEFISEELSKLSKKKKSELKRVNKFITEKVLEVSKVNYFISKEKELELKMVDEFISEEVLEINKKKKSELKRVNKFISEKVLEVSKVKKFIFKKKESDL
ncbi:uncharacterized protein LOC110369528 [Fundulus heteroclitus]|uniref:uncharacterized protein LOC110369528 n=1 Tax=Fundulus heteroclitus TaxID=8078 RepID=UPI00165B1C98|nr:uncharacterized protein LOC110369528 [Fundulus heteroclitus]